MKVIPKGRYGPFYKCEGCNSTANIRRDDLDQAILLEAKTCPKCGRADSQSADRIDAEYFQPVYDGVLKAVKSAKSYARLGNIVTIKKCVEPGSEAYQDSGVPFVRVSNLGAFLKLLNVVWK